MRHPRIKEHPVEALPNEIFELVMQDGLITTNTLLSKPRGLREHGDQQSTTCPPCGDTYTYNPGAKPTATGKRKAWASYAENRFNEIRLVNVDSVTAMKKINYSWKSVLKDLQTLRLKGTMTTKEEAVKHLGKAHAGTYMLKRVIVNPSLPSAFESRLSLAEPLHSGTCWNAGQLRKLFCFYPDNQRKTSSLSLERVWPILPKECRHAMYRQYKNDRTVLSRFSYDDRHFETTRKTSQKCFQDVVLLLSTRRLNLAATVYNLCRRSLASAAHAVPGLDTWWRCDSSPSASPGLLRFHFVAIRPQGSLWARRNSVHSTVLGEAPEIILPPPPIFVPPPPVAHSYDLRVDMHFMLQRDPSDLSEYLRQEQTSAQQNSNGYPLMSAYFGDLSSSNSMPDSIDPSGTGERRLGAYDAELNPFQHQFGSSPYGSSIPISPVWSMV